MKKGYQDNIETVTTENTDYRRVLYTGAQLQLVVMTLQPGEAIGEEVHDTHDQFFRFESGRGEVVVNDQTYTVGDGDAVVVPAGATHNVCNTSATEVLQLYTIYAPPEHRDGTVHTTKADEAPEHFDGTTSE